MGPDQQHAQTQLKAADRLLKPLDSLLNWARSRSLWPMFFGLSCCFVEEATAITARYDIARFGAEVFRPSPRQADLLIISGTVFKKIAPVVRRLYEQMPEPKWVISMGSCSNTGGMYDVYSVVQGVNQILPVDVYIPGCPPRPEAVLEGLTLLQEKIMAKERPARPVLHLAGGNQGTRTQVLIDGQTKSRDPRGPGMNEIPIRGNDASPPFFTESRSDLMWRPSAPAKPLSATEKTLLEDLRRKFGDRIRIHESVTDMPSLSTSAEQVKGVLTYLKTQGACHFRRLEDLTAIDESARRQPVDDRNFTLVYHLTSLEERCRVRIEVPLTGDQPQVQSVTDIWPSANWYEREAYDMFGLRFAGHPRLRRILMPDHWQGHPLRKDHPGRATQMAPYTLDEARDLQPADAGIFMDRPLGEDEMILNVGPHHVSTHGLLRYTVVLDGEEIRDLDMEIGYHHRAAEKVGERQNWHQFIPYTDRVDYLSGAANNLPYVMAVETLADIKVPDRAQYIRILLSELFRLSNHLVFVGTFAHDIGAITPTFYTFREREMVLDIVETITGGRLHPSWFRLGGVAADLPDGWRPMVEDLLKALHKGIDEYEALITKNPIIRSRTMGVGRLTADQAVEWGVTGPNLRACGIAWDLRKTMPYSGYDSLAFEIPTQDAGDSYARYLVRVQEMRESLKIIDQVTRNMPPGRYVSADYRYVVPARADMKKDIESLIHHFVNVTRGPAVPKGQAYAACEVPRGEQGYYVVSDGVGYAYRMRIRAPGFANLQTMPLMARGWTISDLIAIIGSVDYILPDIDR